MEQKLSNQTDWKDKPAEIEIWDNKINYVMFVDENNSDNITNIYKKILNSQPISEDEKYFTITGCVLKREQYSILQNEFENLKKQYWKDGQYYNEKNNTVNNVCFHSRDIRRRFGAFSPKLIDNNKFENDLAKTISLMDFKIISISINIYEYIIKNYKLHLYNVCFDFMLERLIYFMPNNAKSIIMLEARGKKEDSILLQHITNVITKTGTKRIKSMELQQKIYGVYFNPKWNKKWEKTYAGLELADLCSYPIHKYIKLNIKDLAFNCIENKIDCYPNYMNKGLKIFP